MSTILIVSPDTTSSTVVQRGIGSPHGHETCRLHDENDDAVVADGVGAGGHSHSSHGVAGRTCEQDRHTHGDEGREVVGAWAFLDAYACPHGAYGHTWGPCGDAASFPHLRPRPRRPSQDAFRCACRLHVRNNSSPLATTPLIPSRARSVVRH